MLENSAEYLTPFCTVPEGGGEGGIAWEVGGAHVGHSERGEVLRPGKKFISLSFRICSVQRR